jgi:riboflavin biosynthesis pyrimidine reductase
MDRMRALLPGSESDVDVHEFYARDWVEPGGLRCNFVSSVDGAATEHGVTRGLQTPGDNQVFAALRDLADVVLVGAGTVRVEGYGAIAPGNRRTGVRQTYGLSPALPTAVVSRSLALDPGAALFTAAAPGARTIVLTCGTSDPSARAALSECADVVLCGDDDVDLALARGALAERGLRRILCEGGPTLLGGLADARLVDELCLSFTPLLAGPGARRIVGGQAWARTLSVRLTGLLEEGGALFSRYRTQ